MKFIEDMTIKITDYLQNRKNSSIRNILNALDLSDIDDVSKKKIRSIVLDELNQFYIDSCIVLTFIQEKQNGN